MLVEVSDLALVPYFSSLPPRVLSDLQRYVVQKHVAKARMIFIEGEPCEGAYYLKSGKIKIYKTAIDGREQILRVARDGDTFSEISLFDEGLNPATAVALADTTLYFVKKEDFLKILDGHPEVAKALLRTFAARIRHLTELIEDLSFRDTPKRVARFLLESMSEQGAEEGPIARSSTLQEMASMVGSVREVVARSLRKLEKEGFIKMDRHEIVILDPQGLRRMLER